MSDSATPHSAAKRFSILAGVPPAQDSLTDQLQRVYSAAVAAGEYDAADWIRNRFWGELDNPTNASLQPRRLK